jgi:hypothetical protein
MAIIDTVAKKLNMKPKELLNENLKMYLDKRLSKIEADIFCWQRNMELRTCLNLTQS